MAGSQGIRAGRAFVELGAKNNGLMKGLRSAESALKGFGRRITAIGATITAASTAALTPLALAVRAFSNQGDAIAKMSKRTGIAVETLSEMNFALSQSGSSLETFEKGIRRMQRSIIDAGDGLSEQVQALDRIGLSYERLKNLDPEDQFLAIAEGISRVEDPTKKAAAAMELLGRSGTELLPLMQGGADGIAALRRQARELGLTINGDTAASAERLTDALDVLGKVSNAVRFWIGAALAPAVTDLAMKAAYLVVKVLDWVKANGGLIRSFAKFAAIGLAVGAVVIGIGSAFIFFGAAINGVLTVSAAVTAVLTALLSPAALVTAAILGIGAAAIHMSVGFGGAIDWVVAKFGELGKEAGRVLGGIRDALLSGDIELAAQILWTGLKLAWQTGIVELEKLWIGLRGSMIKTLIKLGGEIAEQWVKMVSGATHVWLQFKEWFYDLWKGMVDAAASFILKVQGLVSGWTDEQQAEAQKLLREQSQEDRNDFQAGIDEQRRDAVQKLAAEIGAVESLMAVLASKVDAGTDAAKKATEAELMALREQLKKKLDELIAQAAMQAEDGAFGESFTRWRDAFQDWLDQPDITAAPTEQVRGVFEGGAIAKLLGLRGDNPDQVTQKRIEENTRKTSDHTKKVYDEILRQQPGVGIA